MPALFAMRLLPALRILMAAWLVSAGTLFGETRVIPLPGDYTNFAMNPETGTLGALVGDEVHFFRKADLRKPVPIRSGQTKLGAQARSILFKRFGDSRLFAVTCAGDSRIYLLQADGPDPDQNEFKLLDEVKTEIQEIRSLTGSSNPADPFVYYVDGVSSRHNLGAVSLREKKNLGVVLQDVAACVISANGDAVYTVGFHNPMVSHIRTNGLDDSKPKFVLASDRKGLSLPIVADPLGRLTVVSGKVFDVLLEKEQGNVSIYATAFSKSPPALIGITGNLKLRNSSTPKLVEFEIKAVSYNTFQPIGKPVKVTSSPLTISQDIPGDPMGVFRPMRFFVDEGLREFLVCDRNQVTLVPLDDLELPADPLLAAELRGPKIITVGQEVELTVEPASPNVQVELRGLAPGMKATENRITWTPTTDQVGPVAIQALLKHGTLEKVVSLDFKVQAPHVSLPFAPQGLSPSPDGKLAVIWENPAGKLNNRRDKTPIAPGKSRMAVIRLDSGNVVVKREFAEPIDTALLQENRVLVIPRNPGTSQCDVLDSTTLKRIGSIKALGNIQLAEIWGTKLVIVTNAMIELYDRDSLKRIKQLPNALVNQKTAREYSPALNQGLLIHGVLYDDQLQAKLIEMPSGVVVRTSTASILVMERGRRLDPDGRPDEVREPHTGLAGEQRVLSQGFPELGLRMTLTLTQRRVPVPGTADSQKWLRDLVLAASGSVNQSWTILRDADHLEAPTETLKVAPIVSLAAKTVYLVIDAKLYPWKLPLEQFDPLRLERRQTALALSSDETTKLQHKATGGRAPYQFSLPFEIEGVSLNESSGEATVSNAALRELALEHLLASGWTGEPSALQVKTQSESAKAATQILGRNCEGIPVAVPIAIRASDADLATDSFLYYLLIEVPIEQFQRAAEERAKVVAEKTPKPPPMPEQDAAEDELSKLKEKIKSLEDRVEILTRQLNKLLESLEQK